MKAFIQNCRIGVEKHKPYIAMIVINIIYTGMSLFSKAAISQGMKPSVFVAYRQGFATIALAPCAIFFESKKSPPMTFRIFCKILFVSLCGVTLSLNLYYVGMNYTSATFATAMTNTIPAMVFIMAVCLRMERLERNWQGMAKVLGSVVGISGAMVFTFIKGPPLYPEPTLNHISGQSSSNNRTYSKEDWIKGSILMLGANLTWSLWLIMQGPILKQYPAKLRLTTLQCSFSCIGSTVWGAVIERDISSWKLGWDVNLLSVAYCGIVVTGITYWLQVWVVEKKGPVFTAMFSPLALVLTAFMSAILFKETLHWGSVGGAVLLVGGLYSFLWGKNREAKVETEQKTEQIKEGISLECITCTTLPNEQQTEKKEGCPHYQMP
ncbi:hypothetical protein LguiA_018348 [Lonicera macranthoides]